MAGLAQHRQCRNSSRHGRRFTRHFGRLSRTIAITLERRSPMLSSRAQVIATLNGERKVTSDLLLAADGANSALRHRFVPDAAPSYAGYVAWRGTLDESDTPPHLLAFFDDDFTFSEARSGGHILAYFIPGDGQDVHPGPRRLNWVWYVRADEAELVRALVDKDGKHHHASLPQGVVATNVVADLR